MELPSGHDVTDHQGLQFDVSTSGHGRRFWMRPDQIFTDVNATVADKFLELISDRHEEFFEKLKSETGVQFDNEYGHTVMRGNLEQIILTKMKMEKYVLELQTEQHSWTMMDASSLSGECHDASKRIVIKKEPDMIPSEQDCDWNPVNGMLGESHDESNRTVIKKEAQLIPSEEDCEWNPMNMVLGESSDESKRMVIKREAELNTSENEIREKKPYYFLEQSPDFAVSNDVDQPMKSRRKVRAPRKLAPNSDSDKRTPEEMDEEETVDMMIQLDPTDVMIAGTTSSASRECMHDELVSDDCSFKDASQERFRDAGSPLEYSCELCSFKALKEGQLLKHVLIHGKKNIIHVCDKCSFTSVSFNHYTRHLVSHSEAVFKCPECPYQTDDSKQLTRHVTVKHNAVVPPPSTLSSILQCSECPYNTTKIYHFERHLLVHNRDLKGLLQVYQCDECPYKTHRKEHFHRHRSNVHVRSRPHQCGYCRRSYKSSDSLREHEKKAHAVPRYRARARVSCSAPVVIDF